MNRPWVVSVLGLLFVIAAGVGLYLYSENVATRRALTDSRGEIKRLADALQSAENAKADVQQQLQDRDLLFDQERMHMSQLGNHVKRCQDDIDRLSGKINELNNKLELSGAQNSDLQERLEVRSELVSELRANLAECGVAAQHSENRVSEVQQEFEDLRAKTNGLLEQNDILQSNLNGLKTENESLSAEGELLAQKNRNLEKRLADQTDLGREREAEIVRLDSEKQSLQDRVAEIEQSLTLGSQALLSADARIAELEGTVLSLKQRIDASNQSFQSLEAAFSEAEMQLSNVQNELSVVQNELSACTGGLDSAAERLKALDEKGIDLARQAESAASAFDQSEREREKETARAEALGLLLAEREASIEKLNEQLARLKEEKGTATVAIDRLKDTYDELIKEFQKELETREAAINRLKEQFSVTLLDDVLFDFARASITAKGRQTLGRIGEILQKNDMVEIVVSGHTDDIPIAEKYRFRFPSNWELSAARAAAVVRLFQNSFGIDPSRMTVQGLAYYKPAVPNDSPENRALNRRVEIFITAKSLRPSGALSSEPRASYPPPERLPTP